MANNNANIVIVGNLVRDPEMKNYNGESVVSFSVAVATGKKEEDKWISNFYNVSVWGKPGEWIYPKLQKGTQVQVVGTLMLQDYTDKKTKQVRQGLALRADKVLPLARLKEGPTKEGSDDYSGADPF